VLIRSNVLVSISLVTSTSPQLVDTPAYNMVYQAPIRILVSDQHFTASGLAGLAEWRFKLYNDLEEASLTIQRITGLFPRS
jgi:hypothetical protein